MSSITAIPDVLTGSVALTVTASGGGNVNTITRADANGTRPVRLPSGLTLPEAGTVTITDQEPSLSGRVEYRATTSAGPVMAWVTLGGLLPRFVLPHLPLASVEVDTVFGYQAPRESRATVHEVVGRPAPIITRALMGTRRGTLSVLCKDHTAVLTLTAMLARGEIVLYRQSEHPGMDLYFYPMSVDPVHAEGCWELTVTYIELGYPDGELRADPAWTFAQLAADGGTFAAVITGYEDFNALHLNEPTP